MSLITDHIAWVTQIASCFFMTGVIAVIQLTHYPSFADIAPDRFVASHQRHCNALGVIAGPAMCVEIISAAWLAIYWRDLWILNAIAVVVTWGVTFLISVPAHNRLATGFDRQAWLLLVRSNWLRTILWSARSGAILAWLMLVQRI